MNPPALPARTPRLLALLVASVLPFLAASTARAGLAEPDNLVYGQITLDDTAITAARTDVIVEARRTPDGPPIATYRMGDDARAGDFYRLRVRLEDAAPLTADEAALSGDRLHLVATGLGGAAATATFEVGTRGQITRIDLGNDNPDQDQNGLPDDWEILHFGQTGNDPDGDPDGDGRSNLKEYTEGTNPTVPNFHHLTALALGTGSRVQLQGLGLPGRTYVIQATDDLVKGTWSPVAQQVAAPDGSYTAEDADPTPRTSRYYRSLELP